MAEKTKDSMGPNTTLLTMALKMGQALVPADTSKMFKEQFEALGEMHKAKANMITGLVTSGLDVLQKGIDKKKAKRAKSEKLAQSSIEGGNYGDNKRELANTLREMQKPVTRTPKEIEGNQDNEIDISTTDYTY